MKSYDIIAFDLDGTLTNPERGLISSYKYAFHKMGIPIEPDEKLRRFIGPPLYDEWQACYGLTPEEAAETVKYFREFFSVYGWWDNELYPGIREMLAGLKEAGKKIVLSTSKPEVFAKKILELFDIAQYFDVIGAATLDHSREKKSEVLSYALSEAGATDLSRCILVGDRMFDAEGARICGIDSLGVLYGHGTRAELEGEQFVALAESADEVYRLLKD